MHLVERAQCATESDYDTDDLIEDARNFVITGKRYSSYQRFLKNVTISFRAAGNTKSAHIDILCNFPSKLVDMSDWADIDEKRWTRRQKRKEKRRKGATGDRSKTLRCKLHAA